MRYSGENWEMESPVHLTLQVIEPAKPPKKARGKKRKKARKVPFGFARALPKHKRT